MKRFFSWRRHKRRLGAASILQQFIDDEKALLSTNVTPDYFKNRQSRDTLLFSHLVNLEAEFRDRPLLLLYHAVLIVLIRREYKTEAVYSEFDKLWQTYSGELCRQLNLRWLTSAADTFIDHHPDNTVRALMLNVSFLINTIKVYESEHLDCSHSCSNTLTEKLPLFDGLETFFVNHDDSLSNLRERMKSLCRLYPQGGILETVFDRLSATDTAYARLKELHKQKRTQWWDT